MREIRYNKDEVNPVHLIFIISGVRAVWHVYALQKGFDNT